MNDSGASRQFGAAAAAQTVLMRIGYLDDHDICPTCSINLAISGGRAAAATNELGRMITSFSNWIVGVCECVD